ncbi:hypothetical protein RIF29_06810 [Crotalaria pallida]|uniref:Uncharacterized protein n=1 Tax=Crotalaria pallida TaxID=3830 RepID=A0AAN9J3J0_CROPI
MVLYKARNLTSTNHTKRVIKLRNQGGFLLKSLVRSSSLPSFLPSFLSIQAFLNSSLVRPFDTFESYREAATIYLGFCFPPFILSIFCFLCCEHLVIFPLFLQFAIDSGG